MPTDNPISQDEVAGPFSQRELLLCCHALVAVLVLAVQTISTP